METHNSFFKVSPDSRIHKLPWPLRICLYTLGPLIGAILWLILFALHRSCRLVETYQDPSTQEAACIHAVWHGDFILYLCGVFRFRHHAWLHHDGYYLSPGLWTLTWMGIDRFVPVSREHPGKLAAQKLIQHLQNGYSTFVTPDGPFGPGKQVKSGVLHFSQQSGLSVVPLQIDCDRTLTLPSWDRKQIPLPFSTITIRYGSPIRVTDENFERSSIELKRQLDGTF